MLERKCGHAPKEQTENNDGQGPTNFAKHGGMARSIVLHIGRIANFSPGSLGFRSAGQRLYYPKNGKYELVSGPRELYPWDGIKPTCHNKPWLGLSLLVSGCFLAPPMFAEADKATEDVITPVPLLV